MIWVWVYKEVIGKDRAKKSFICYSNQLPLVFNYYMEQNQFLYWTHPVYVVNSKKMIGTYLFPNHCIKFRDMKYYYGTNKYSAEKAIQMIEKEVKENKENNYKPKYNEGFTSKLGERLCIDKIKEKFPIVPQVKDFIYEMPQGALILTPSRDSVERTWNYDIHTAYPAIFLENKMPKEIVKVKNFCAGEQHIVKLRIKNFKAKYLNLYPLYLNKNAQKNHKGLEIIGKRVISGKSYTFTCFYENEIEILKDFYDIEEIEVIEIYRIIFAELPPETIENIKEMYAIKSGAANSSDYDGVKQTVNRLYGYFATLKPNKNGRLVPRDINVPWLFSSYIVSRERVLLYQFIKRVGINHLVAAHTDGVKFDCDCTEVMKELNEERGTLFLDCGHWDEESPMYKVQYLSNTRAKYLDENGELKMKHGGINEEDIKEFIKNKTIDEITAKTLISYTIKKRIVEDNGIIRIENQKIIVPLKNAGVKEELK